MLVKDFVKELKEKAKDAKPITPSGTYDAWNPGPDVYCVGGWFCRAVAGSKHPFPSRGELSAAMMALGCQKSDAESGADRVVTANDTGAFSTAWTWLWKTLESIPADKDVPKLAQNSYFN